jgi:hypothetical protein
LSEGWRPISAGSSEYQPTVARIHSGKSEHVAKELPIGVRVRAVKEEVSTGDHFGMQI